MYNVPPKLYGDCIQVTIATDDMDLAGDLIQGMAEDFEVEVASLAHTCNEYQLSVIVCI